MRGTNKVKRGIRQLRKKKVWYCSVMRISRVGRERESNRKVRRRSKPNKTVKESEVRGVEGGSLTGKGERRSGKAGEGKRERRELRNCEESYELCIEYVRD